MTKENENDQRQLFKVVKGLCRSFKESPLPEPDSKEELAENFWQFFVGKIYRIRDNFGSCKGFDKYDTGDFVVPKLSQFTPVSVEEISKIVLKSLSKSFMLDPIPTSLLKECKSELMPIITKIVNLSIKTGEMPNDFKHAVITPLLKKKGIELIYKNFSLCLDYPSYPKSLKRLYHSS